MDPVPQFSRTYAEARTKFHQAARARGLAIETHALPELHGIDGEPLAMDVALLGAPDATGLLMLTSATHGIEGYCGSGCQVGLLRDPAFVAAVQRAGVAVLFVHAVNPHGFSHGRRVNEDNADLNRNFRDFTQPAPVNAAYAELHPLLLPATWPSPEENERQLAAYVAAHGERAYQAAVSGGQYAYPDGLFYGGKQATWSNRTLHAVLRRHAFRRQRLAWIDFHTGLGPWGHGEKIYAGRDLPADLARARTWWGGDVTSFHDGSSTSALVTGVVTNAAYDECRGVEFAAIALEYGTVPLADVFAALRADHWLHNHPEAPAAQQAAIRQQMRAAFYGDTDDWKLAVYMQARENALKAVARVAPHQP
jgi:predicted deacylase